MPGTFAYDAGTNTVIVTGGTSGSPADFASCVAADRSGTLTLKAATAPALGIALTTQIRPCEKLALPITFVLSGTNAGSGDTIDITGTDAWGDAQTESILVGAGNGAYVSSKHWRTITSFSCIGFNDGVGTVTVTQPQWGVIWNRGNGQYQIDCLIIFGDGSTSTYFGDAGKQISFKPNLGDYGNYYITVTANATLRLGTLLNATTFATENGCNILASESSWYKSLIYSNAATATILLYSTSIFSYGSNHLGLTFAHNSSPNQIFNVLISSNFIYNSVSIQSGTNTIISNLRLVRGQAIDLLSDVRSMTLVSAQIYASWGNTSLFKNVTIIEPFNGEDIAVNGLSGVLTLRDCILGWIIHWDSYSGSAKIYRQSLAGSCESLRSRAPDFFRAATPPWRLTAFVRPAVSSWRRAS